MVAYLCDDSQPLSFAHGRTVEGGGRFPAANLVMNPADKSPSQRRRDAFRSHRRASAADNASSAATVHHVAVARGKGPSRRLTTRLPDVRAWTREGGIAWAAILPGQRFETEIDEARAAGKFLGEDQDRRLVSPMASTPSRRSSAMPRRAVTSARPSGRNDGCRRCDYLMQNEWARFPDDILWRTPAQARPDNGGLGS